MAIANIHKLFLECGSISTDSRTVEPGQLFVALKGDNFDGHAYVDEVLQKGARYVLISDKSKQADQTILVEDTLKALQDLARYHRDYLAVPVIGITGSNGKTTTKELLMQVMSLKYKVHATKGNFNNHIGVPLTLLAATSEAELLIVEMGANHIGEIDFLCSICKPDYGLITNIGNAHIEGFGSYDRVVIAKTELYRHLLTTDKVAFYNRYDTVLYDNLPDGIKTVPYLDEVEFSTDSYFVELKKNGSQAYSATQLVGNYNSTNMKAAITVGQYFGIPISEMIAAICSYKPSNNRSQIVHKAAVDLILDAYNANPSSMEASIVSFAHQDTAKKKVLVLGDMKELGNDSVVFHKDILEIVAQYKWHKVILVGEDFGKADKEKVYPQFPDIKALSQSRSEIMTMLKDSICLVKASRSLQLEKIRSAAGLVLSSVVKRVSLVDHRQQ